MLIWYSKVNQILQEINLRKDLMINLFKLSEYDEMTNPIKHFIHILLMNSETSNSDADEESKHALNTNMILGIWHTSSSLITDLKKKCDVINDHMYRSPFNERELHFIYKVSHDLLPDLNLILY